MSACRRYGDYGPYRFRHVAEVKSIVVDNRSQRFCSDCVQSIVRFCGGLLAYHLDECMRGDVLFALKGPFF